MPVRCRMIDYAEMHARGEHPQPGDMWYALALIERDVRYRAEGRQPVLSNEYRRDWLGKRPPLIVALPNGDWFPVDGPTTEATDGHGWAVTGEPPAITVSPSINAVDRYHGSLTAGVFTDDPAMRS